MLLLFRTVLLAAAIFVTNAFSDNGECTDFYNAVCSADSSPSGTIFGTLLTKHSEKLKQLEKSLSTIPQYDELQQAISRVESNQGNAKEYLEQLKKTTPSEEVHELFEKFNRLKQFSGSHQQLEVAENADILWSKLEDFLSNLESTDIRTLKAYTALENLSVNSLISLKEEESDLLAKADKVQKKYEKLLGNVIRLVKDITWYTSNDEVTESLLKNTNFSYSAGIGATDVFKKYFGHMSEQLNSAKSLLDLKIVILEAYDAAFQKAKEHGKLGDLLANSDYGISLSDGFASGEIQMNIFGHMLFPEYLSDYYISNDTSMETAAIDVLIISELLESIRNSGQLLNERLLQEVTVLYSRACELYGEKCSFTEDAQYENAEELIAFRIAYKLYEEKLGNSFDDNHRKKFFESFAAFSCMPQSVRQKRGQTSRRVRVNVAVGRIEDYRKVYGCTEEDKMIIELNSAEEAEVVKTNEKRSAYDDPSAKILKDSEKSGNETETTDAKTESTGYDGESKPSKAEPIEASLKGNTTGYDSPVDTVSSNTTSSDDKDSAKTMLNGYDSATAPAASEKDTNSTEGYEGPAADVSTNITSDASTTDGPPGVAPTFHELQKVNNATEVVNNSISSPELSAEGYDSGNFENGLTTISPTKVAPGTKKTPQLASPKVAATGYESATPAPVVVTTTHTTPRKLAAVRPQKIAAKTVTKTSKQRRPLRKQVQKVHSVNPTPVKVQLPRRHLKTTVRTAVKPLCNAKKHGTPLARKHNKPHAKLSQNKAKPVSLPSRKSHLRHGTSSKSIVTQNKKPATKSLRKPTVLAAKPRKMIGKTAVSAPKTVKGVALIHPTTHQPRKTQAAAKKSSIAVESAIPKPKQSVTHAKPIRPTNRILSKTIHRVKAGGLSSKPKCVPKAHSKPTIGSHKLTPVKTVVKSVTITSSTTTRTSAAVTTVSTVHHDAPTKQTTPPSVVTTTIGADVEAAGYDGVKSSVSTTTNTPEVKSVGYDGVESNLSTTTVNPKVEAAGYDGVAPSVSTTTVKPKVESTEHDGAGASASATTVTPQMESAGYDGVEKSVPTEKVSADVKPAGYDGTESPTPSTKVVSEAKPAGYDGEATAAVSPSSTSAISAATSAAPSAGYGEDSGKSTDADMTTTAPSSTTKATENKPKVGETSYVM